MNATLKHTIIQEVENLIDHSCATGGTENSNFDSLHQAILKKYFEAETVVFDSTNNLISLEVTEKENTTKAVHIDTDFNQLPEFLKSCIEKDHSSLRFYKNLLRYYHVVHPLSA